MPDASGVVLRHDVAITGLCSSRVRVARIVMTILYLAYSRMSAEHTIIDLVNANARAVAAVLVFPFTT